MLPGVVVTKTRVIIVKPKGTSVGIGINGLFTRSVSQKKRHLKTPLALIKTTNNIQYIQARTVL